MSASSGSINRWLTFTLLLAAALALVGCASTERTRISDTLDQAARLRAETESSVKAPLARQELSTSRFHQQRAETLLDNFMSQPVLEISDKTKLIEQAEAEADASLKAAEAAREVIASEAAPAQAASSAAAGETGDQGPPGPVTAKETAPARTGEEVQDQVVQESQLQPEVKEPAEMETKPAAKVTPVASSDQSVARALPARRIYSAALADYRARRFSRARQGFRDFLDSYPGHDLAPNAQYWLGETLYAEGRWSQALAAFKAVRANYPASRKDADALCKVGLTQRNMGNLDQARSTLKACVEGYPKSRAAAIARTALDKMD